MLHSRKILTAQQIREADAYTIREGNITSVGLMERAAEACVRWITENNGTAKRFAILCGMGNNGGDGLAIARLLAQLHETISVDVYLLRISDHGSPDFLTNYGRVKQYPKVNMHELPAGSEITIEQPVDLLIDAIIGSGLSAPVTDWLKEVIEKINKIEIPIVSIDIPSGLIADTVPAPGTIAVKATHVLSFQFPKFLFMFPESENFMEQFHVLPIGLDERYIEQAPVKNYYIIQPFIDTILKRRNKFAHKGTFGHALLIVGSYGKMGAAVLASKACLRAGAGLLTAHVPAKGVAVLQTAFPEAMVSVDADEKIISSLPEDLSSYNAIGIGPGIGKDAGTQNVLQQILTQAKTPLVLDADALNILSENKEWLKLLPENTILTPHVKEFERLAGVCYPDSLARLEAVKAFAAQHKLIVVLKGAHTAVCTSSGDVYFNSTGNPGMATAGSGDVLTGIITSLLAQGYAPQEAAVLGIFLHGRAGDKAAGLRGENALIASDIVNELGL